MNKKRCKKYQKLIKKAKKEDKKREKQYNKYLKKALKIINKYKEEN